MPLEEMGFTDPTSEEGGSYYPCAVLLKAWVYGYFKGIKTTRSLEDACRNRLDFIWLVGERAPDHNTLWRFISRHKDAIKELFVKCVKVGYESGLVGLKLHGVDGTKIRARCSDRSGLRRKELQKALLEIESDVKRYIDEVESSHDSDEAACLIPDDLADRQKLRETILESLANLDEIDRDYMNPHEPDARKMKTTEGISYGYNAQAVVDETSGMIVAAEVVNSENDIGQLVPMLEMSRENVGESCEETVADAGYASGEEFLKAEEKGIEVLVNLSKHFDPPEDEEHRFHSSRFEYDESRDEFICPLGARLTFEREKRSRNKKGKIRIYRCRCHADCPERFNCSKMQRGRTIEYSESHAAVRHQRIKQKDPSKKKMLGNRFCFVERVFALIKQHMGFRRWTFYGLDGVRTQWRMLCIAHNLKQLYKFWLNGDFVLNKSWQNSDFMLNDTVKER